MIKEEKGEICKGEVCKRGQVTAFIIIAILIVGAILLFFLWIRPTYIAPSGERLGFEGCIKDAVESEMKILGEQAGFVNPKLSYMYQNHEIGYLCYTNLYYKQCVVQKPFLKQHFESELKKKTGEKIHRCYENSVDELKAKGYEVRAGTLDFEILLEPGKIFVELDAPVSISKQATQRFTRFEIDINSPIYEMLMIATSLLQYETKFGDSDTTSLMIFYPEFIIDKLKQSDGTTIYIITDKNTKTKFQFASRSMAWPAGYGIGGV